MTAFIRAVAFSASHDLAGRRGGCWGCDGHLGVLNRIVKNLEVLIFLESEVVNVPRHPNMEWGCHFQESIEIPAGYRLDLPPIESN